jgi:branched-subunit amino acid aminotransferase/4-amino-4-deoxychorismate lyase
MAAELKVWLNGEFIPESGAFLPVTERGFLYADGIFTTFRLYNGRIFLAENHFARLSDSANFLGLPRPKKELFTLAEELADMNGHEEGAGRITISRGSLPFGPKPGPAASPTVLISTRPLPPSLPKRKTNGVKGRTLPWPSRAEGLPLQSHKTLAYLQSVLALGLTEEGAEPILETVGGYLCEGATSNLFWVREGIVRTPSLTSGCLPGVARSLVFKLAEKEGVRVEEGLFSRSDLFKAGEAFLTNCVSELVPLVEIDGSPIGGGLPGKVTSLLSERWNQETTAFSGKSK